MSTADVGSWHDIGIWQVCFLVDSGSWHGTQEHKSKNNVLTWTEVLILQMMYIRMKWVSDQSWNIKANTLVLHGYLKEQYISVWCVYVCWQQKLMQNPT